MAWRDSYDLESMVKMVRQLPEQKLQETIFDYLYHSKLDNDLGVSNILEMMFELWKSQNFEGDLCNDWSLFFLDQLSATKIIMTLQATGEKEFSLGLISVYLVVEYKMSGKQERMLVFRTIYSTDTGPMKEIPQAIKYVAKIIQMSGKANLEFEIEQEAGPDNELLLACWGLLDCMPMAQCNQISMHITDSGNSYRDSLTQIYSPTSGIHIFEFAFSEYSLAYLGSAGTGEQFKERQRTLGYFSRTMQRFSEHLVSLYHENQISTPQYIHVTSIWFTPFLPRIVPEQSESVAFCIQESFDQSAQKWPTSPSSFSTKVPKVCKSLKQVFSTSLPKYTPICAGTNLKLFLDQLREYLPKLKQLSLTGLLSISGKTLADNIKECLPNLEVLTLGVSPQVYGWGDETTGVQDLEILRSYLKQNGIRFIEQEDDTEESEDSDYLYEQGMPRSNRHADNTQYAAM